MSRTRSAMQEKKKECIATLPSSQRKEIQSSVANKAAQIAQASLLTTQGGTFLKKKQRISPMTVSFGNKVVK